MEKVYLFVLGRDPELSKIEIESLLQTLNLDFGIIDSNNHVAVVKMSGYNSNIINRLGGTIKIAEVISNTNKIEEIETNLEKADLYPGTKNKILYFITPFNTDLLSYVEDFLKDYFRRIKLKALYKKNNSPSSLIRKEILEEGLDIVIYKKLIAKTIAVSNPLELKQRDLGRPAVDYMKSISIRLAKILINLSKTKESQILIDPFCGSGTILQEAMLNDINVIGLDVDKTSIEQTKLNLEWLKDAYPLKSNYRLLNLDCRKLNSIIKKADSIVTEPYLGPFIRKVPSLFQAKQLIEELTDLYNSLLKQANLILSKGKRIVLILPRFKTLEGKMLYVDISYLAEQNGFYLAYKPIIYAYKESKLIREICVLEKN